MNASLTSRRLRELLDYNPKTGVFTCRVRRGGLANPGAIAGEITNHGYRRITLDGKKYLGSHLAWFWTKGRWPKKQLDHKNGDRLDDRFSNLRQANPSQNGANSRTKKNNAFGLKGVGLDSRSGRFRARIYVNYHDIHLGLHDTAEAAHAAYLTAARKHFGAFARAR